MFSRAALNAFVSVTIGRSEGEPVGAGVGAMAGFAALACCLEAGLVLSTSLGGVTVISGSVVWPGAHCSAAWTTSAQDATNRIRRKRGRIESSPDAQRRHNKQMIGGGRQLRRSLPAAARESGTVRRALRCAAARNRQEPRGSRWSWE